jgi:hypothetical protein
MIFGQSGENTRRLQMRPQTDSAIFIIAPNAGFEALMQFIAEQRLW